MKKNLFMLTLPLLLISCIEVRDTNKQKAVPDVEVAPVIEVRALAQPHRYAVLITGSGIMTRILRKPISLLNQSPTTQIPTSENHAEDVVDQPGLYEYSVQQGSQHYQLQVDVPEDYVVEGNMKIEQLSLNIKNESDEFRVFETSGRLFFKAGSKLSTNGENFLIKVAMVDSEGARIETFPEGQKAQPGNHGRHGGKIKIETQSLMGTLHVVLRGENGGHGEGSVMGTGKRLEQLNNNGSNGGNSGYLEADIVDSSKGDITFDLLPGAAGEGVEIRIICLSKPCANRVYRPKGTNGAAGIAQQPVLKLKK